MIDEVLERALRDALDLGGDASEVGPPRLAEAQAYAVFPGGARIRPRLCLEVARACGGVDELVYAAAASVELLHCASLVHDDLPCFDAGAMRRGRPAVHRVYGEAMAVLVGDGLMVQSFATLARGLAHRPEAGGAPLVALLQAAGPRTGLVAGQAWELEPAPALAAYHRAKTAALFEVSAALGALVNNVDAAPFVALGRAFGMAYQLADDVADVLGDPTSLGKAVGRDRELGRPTAVSDAMSPAESLERLRRAGEAVLGLVPPCAGELALRRFVDAACKALVDRCRAAQDERLSA